jgi:hypothetical protein
MPQAFGSSGAQTGTGSMLVRAAVTLFWVEAEEVRVVAAAPVRARTTTRVRIASFMELAPWGDWLGTD